MVEFKEICVITAALPMVTLFVCFVSAYIFQSEEIHETHCRVYNVIPSISAITGVSPQRYLWRICVALHIGPRFAIAAVYRNYYRCILKEKNLLQVCCLIIFEILNTYVMYVLINLNYITYLR